MHPLLSNPRRLLVYLLSWVPFGWFVHNILEGAGLADGLIPGSAPAVMALLFAFLALSARYSNLRAPLDTSSTARILATQAAAAFVTVGLWLALSAGFLSALERLLPQPGLVAALGAASPLLAGVGGVGFTLSAVIHYLSTAAEQSRRAERRALELQVVARDAQLRTLRAQIDPHFLFNCLHSISALTTVDPPAARRMCVLLGDFLRTSLKVGDQPTITLGEELALMRAYLSIEQVRLGSRLAVDAQVAADTEHVRVPPLLLHPLVENAVTHGIGQMVDGGRVELRVGRDADRLRIVVANSCDPDGERRSGAGVGLQNVRQRLETVYGHAASLTLRPGPDWFEAELILPAGA